MSMTSEGGVYDLKTAQRLSTEQTAALAHGGGGGNYGEMEVRIRRLEKIIPTLATKADVAELRAASKADIAELRAETKVGIAELRADFHKSTNELIKWIVGTAFVGIALFITIMTFVLNNAVPKTSAPAAQLAPIVIQLPAQQQAPLLPAEPARQP